MSITAGTEIGRYKILSKLGEGGMGEVYVAEDTQLHRKVALKVLPEDLAANHDRMQRFKQEAKTASALNHPNILTIFEIGYADSTHFIATEFIDGETLRQHIRGARMKLSDVLTVSIQIVDAIAAAHEAGIIHRDIKPENIMLRQRDAYVKVLDFGLAKLIEQPVVVDSETPTKTLFKTAEGIVVGTVIYMSPEQARGVEVDARTDIWSLGVVLYEMVAGCRPFEGSTAGEILASIINEKEPPPLARFAREVPAELERMVEKALRKDREERYQTAKDMLLDLKRLKQKLELDAEIERTAPPELRYAGAEAPPSEEREIMSTAPGGASHTAVVGPRTTSSVEYIAGEIKRHKRGALLLLVALVAATAAITYFAYWGSPGRGSAGKIRSIAVLPFTNADGNPDAEYLSDGISETLINSLSQLPGITVIARSSSFRYKGKEVDPQEVAKALGVEAILTGRVVQRGDTLLISAELVNASDKTHVWGDQYNRRATDVLQVQSEISREIAEKLRLRLTPGDERQLSRRETVNPAAYELLLKGRFYFRKGGTENQKKAIEYFKQAIALDPDYALAHAELSASYSYLVGGSRLDPKEFTPQAEAAARRSLELDEGLADAHLALANIKQNSWDWGVAEQHYKRAIELNPNLAEAYRWYSVYLSVSERHEQAINEMKRARALDPLSLLVGADVGFSLLLARQYDQAIESLKKTLELDQNYAVAHGFLGYTYAAKGMYAEAITEYQEVIKLDGDSSSTQVYLGAAYAKAGERGKAREILKRLQTSGEYVSPGELAVLHAALGEQDQAFASLEKAYAAHDLQMKYLGVDPALDSLRSDPRFKDLMRRIGLPQ